MTIELGGNISLVGFSGREFTELIVVKKIVGQYARRFSDHMAGFGGLKIILEDEGHGMLDVKAHARLDGHDIEGSAQDRNLFVALDNAIKRAEEGMRKRHEIGQAAHHREA